LIPRDVVDFVLATQPKKWRRLSEHYGAAVKERLVRRVASEIERRGALDVLRNGIRDSGGKFQFAYFRPSSGLNEETQRLHAGNLFAVVRQLRYSRKNEKSPRSRIVSERDPDFHCRAQKSPHRAGGRERDPAVQDRPRPARTAVYLWP